MKRTIEEWAQHIITRFGYANAHHFASYNFTDCPCIFLNRDCDDCKHKPNVTPELVLCDEANDFVIAKRNHILFIEKLKSEIVRKCLMSQ